MQEKLNNGQSLFEVVVAIAISAIIIVALVALAANSIRNATFARNKTQAGRYAEEATEWLRGQRDMDISTFKSNSLVPVWCLSFLFATPSDWSAQSQGDCSQGEEIPGTKFFRELEFPDDGNPDVIQVDVVVFWTDSQGTHEVRSATNLSDWRQR